MSSVQNIAELDVVALLRDLPEDGLVRGQVGTVVDLNPTTNTFIVEFINDHGEGVAFPTLSEADVLLLRYQRVAAAAAAAE